MQSMQYSHSNNYLRYMLSFVSRTLTLKQGGVAQAEKEVSVLKFRILTGRCQWQDTLISASKLTVCFEAKRLTICLK